MNTTLIAMDKTSMKILEHCGAIADVTCTQITQPEILPNSDGMIITISHGDDSAWLAKPRSSAFEQELNYVIIPYGQREKLEEKRYISLQQGEMLFLFLCFRLKQPMRTIIIRAVLLMWQPQ